MDKVVIVGKGPSLINSRLGKQIDGFNTVVRVTNGRRNRDYGYKTDYILTISLESYLLNKVDLSKVRDVWLYDTEIEWGEVNGTHINNHISHWLNIYKKVAKPLNQKHHPHVTYPSKGTAAALTAIELLKPNEICLAGMDNVTAGRRTYHCHDFSAENFVIQQAIKKYSVKIIGL